MSCRHQLKHDETKEIQATAFLVGKEKEKWLGIPFVMFALPTESNCTKSAGRIKFLSDASERANVSLMWYSF
jgi:hypothetical protein